MQANIEEHAVVRDSDAGKPTYKASWRSATEQCLALQVCDKSCDIADTMGKRERCKRILVDMCHIFSVLYKVGATVTNQLTADITWKRSATWALMFQVLTVLTSTSRLGKPAALRRMSLHLLAGKSARVCTGGKYGTCICQ